MMGCHPRSFPSSRIPILPRTAFYLGPGLLPSCASWFWEGWQLGQQPQVKRPFPCLVGPRLGPPWALAGLWAGYGGQGGDLDSRSWNRGRDWSQLALVAEKWVVGLSLHLEL